MQYDAYLEKMKALPKYATKDGCVDSIRNNEDGTEEANLYAFLRGRAQRINCSIFDYMILMTNYHFSYGYVLGNYVDNTKMLANELVQNGSVKSIMHIDPKLLHKIQHLSKYSLHENPSVREVLNGILEIDVEGYYATHDYTKMDEDKLIEKIRVYADENGDISGISKKDPKLYAQLLASTRGETPRMLLERHGLTNSKSPTKAKPRLSYILTTYEQRKVELFPIRDQIIAEGQAQGNYNFDEMTELQRYYARLEIAQKTIETYYALGLQRYSDGFFNEGSEDVVETSQLEHRDTDENLSQQPELESEFLEQPTDQTIEKLESAEPSILEGLLRQKFESNKGIPQPLADTTCKIDDGDGQ